MFNTFSEEKDFMLECHISYIANCYFGSDCMSVTSNVLQIGSGSNWYEIGSKACYILKVSTFYMFLKYRNETYKRIKLKE